MKFVVGITGASGAIYAKRLLERLASIYIYPDLVITDYGYQVWAWEIGDKDFLEKYKIYSIDDMRAPFASGSARYEAMIVIPCSMGTLGKIANGISDNLLTRAADVMLKENRRLIIVPREMPYNLIHLENMRRLILAGAVIIPASPSFYSKPQSINQLIDTVIDKVFFQLDISFDHYKWGEEN